MSRMWDQVRDRLQAAVELRWLQSCLVSLGGMPEETLEEAQDFLPYQPSRNRKQSRSRSHRVRISILQYDRALVTRGPGTVEKHALEDSRLSHRVDRHNVMAPNTTHCSTKSS